MKKKILITLLIIIVILIVLFLINYIKEKKDASITFVLDNENKYILNYIGYPAEGGFASSNYYCEIDLNNNYIDCRYDFEYWFPERVSKLESFMKSKKRKLVKRYSLTSKENETLKKIFERYINEPELNDTELNDVTKSEVGLNNIISKEPEFNYYVLDTKNSRTTIKNSERKEELKQTLKNIDEKLYSFLLKE